MNSDLPPNLGPTGNYPRGKLRADDDGELQLAIAANLKDRVVEVHFGTPVVWFALSPEDTLTLAQNLTAKANELLRTPNVH